MSRSRLLIGAVLLASLLAIGATSCGDDDDVDSSPTATTEVSVADTETPPAGSETVTQEPGGDQTPRAPRDFEGSRDPVELPGDGGSGTQLKDVRIARHGDFDRVVFEFDSALPGVNAEYVSPPAVACGSGLPVEVAGDAFLEIRMSPAAAHDEAGELTFGPQAISPGLQSILAVVSICDFEGQVTWVVGLTSEADFTVVTLADGFRIVVDVAHP